MKLEHYQIDINPLSENEAGNAQRCLEENAFICDPVSRNVYDVFFDSEYNIATMPELKNCIITPLP